MKLRVGLVGIGPAWESRHRPALRALSDRFDVRAVCEQVAHRAEMIARDFDAQPVDGFNALAMREDIDALMLLGRQWFGHLPIVAACEYGKAVYCATGLDVEVDQARTLRRQVEESGVAFMAELPRRHAPATIRLKELIATHLGPPRLLFCHLRVPVDNAQPKNMAQSAQNGRHEIVELVDWCRYVVGAEPTSVLGMQHSDAAGADLDYQSMSLDFSPDGAAGKGAVAQISCGRYMPAAWPEAAAFRPPAALQVACCEGIAFVDLPSTLVWFDRAGRHMEQLDNERPVGEAMLSQFYRSVTSLVRSTGSLDDAFRALAVMEAVHISHQEGRRVPLCFD